MASVYQALDLRNDRLVAMKVLNPNVAQELQFRARFEREIKVLRSLKHPNIVPILDHGHVDEYAYIVMPFYKGGTLQDRLRKGPLSLEEGARILSQVTAALEYSHKKGIVHRDIKPSNFLLDDHGDALLTDFGLARIHDQSMSLTGSATIGTPAYMSPEQCTGKVDARSDQYSLGVVLYQLATGRLPFEADTPVALAIKHVSEPMTRPREVNPNVPPSVEAVLMKAMSKSPADRYGSVADMNNAFRQAIAPALVLDGNTNPVELPFRTMKIAAHQPKKQQSGSIKVWLQQRIRLVFLSLAILLCCLVVSMFTFLRFLPSIGATFGRSALPTKAVWAAALNVDGDTPAGGGDLSGQADYGTSIAMSGYERTSTVTISPTVEETQGVLTLTMAYSLTATYVSSGTPSGTQLPTIPQSMTPTKTSALTATRTKTSKPTSTRQPISTATRTVTVTLTPTITHTPTFTYTPTFTPSPTPSPTPTPLPCENARLENFERISAKSVSWSLVNNGWESIQITRIIISWPYPDGGFLNRVRLNFNAIWEGSPKPSPATINSGWTGASRIVDWDDSKRLEFRFDNRAYTQASVYLVRVQLNGVCEITSP